MTENPLPEGPFAFLDLLRATSGCGTSFRVAGDDIRYACFACSAVFPQTSEGFQELRAHESEHGRARSVNMAELNGKTLRIFTWASKQRDDHPDRVATPEIWGVDDADGMVYYLSNAYQSDNVWKWRINSLRSGALAFLNAATLTDHD